MPGLNIQKMTIVDLFLGKVDMAMKTIFPPPQRISQRPSPALDQPEPSLSPAVKKHIASLVRINHVGEVCAQALYQGQSLGATTLATRKQMAAAAEEEIDHLAWCESRLMDLGGRISYANPVWYSLSFLLGTAAGFAGDKTSLGFVVETERQVMVHLQKHLKQLPSEDKKTAALFQQMIEDEAAHATKAKAAGGSDLPRFITKIMQWMSGLMVHTAYYI